MRRSSIIRSVLVALSASGLAGMSRSTSIRNASPEAAPPGALPTLTNGILAGQMASWTDQNPCPTPPPLHLPLQCCHNLSGQCGGLDEITLDDTPPVAIGPCEPISAAPVNLATGKVHEDVVDFSAPAPGMDIVIGREFEPNETNVWWGDGSLASMQIIMSQVDVLETGPQQITVARFPGGTWLYHVDYGTEVAITPDDEKNGLLLEYDEGTNEITATWPTGERAVFYGWQVDGTGPYTAGGGSLKRYELSSGGLGMQFGYTGDLYDPDVRPLLDYIKYGTTTTTYRYVDVAPLAYGLDWVKVYAGDDTSDELIGEVDYTYYGELSGSNTQNGSGNDLITVTVKRRMTGDSGSTLSESRTTMYRYYNDTSGSGGGAGSLKMIFRPEAYQQLYDYGQSLSPAKTVYELTDAQADDFASNYFFYSHPSKVGGTDRYVTSEIVRTSCGSCGGSGGLNGETIYYDYFDTVDDHEVGREHWPAGTLAVWEATVTQPDDIKEHTFISDDGFVVKKVIDPVPATQDANYWATQWTIDQYGRTTSIARADGSTVTVGHDSDTSTVLGRINAITIDKSGSSRKIFGLTYTSDTTHSRVASRSTYENANGTGALTTSAAYNSVMSGTGTEMVITGPTVSLSRNGDNTAYSSSAVYDNLHKKVIWTKDGRGRVDFYQYDIGSGLTNTGLLRFHIADINTGGTQPTGVSLGTIPSGYSTSSGANLVTEYVRDNLGRPIKRIDPDGLATYSVYKDREMRTHVGFDAVSGNSAKGTSKLPTSVVITDRAGNVTEAYSVAADFQFNRNSTTGYPTGTSDSISDSNKVAKHTRTYNIAGMLTEERTYFDIDDGTNGYSKTEYGYDNRGRRSRIVDPMGTIRRIEFDPYGRPISTWVGTDDTPTSGTWSSSNPTGTDLEKVKTYTFGDTVATTGKALYLVKEVFPIDDTSGNDREVKYTYDLWGRRTGRFAGTAASVESLADTWVYDNHDRVIEHYRREGFTLSSNVPQENGTVFNTEFTWYDERGRVWKEEFSHTGRDIGQSGTDGGGSVQTITAYTWYTRTDQPIKKQTVGLPARKWVYDLLGRTTTQYITDAGSDVAGGSSSDSLTSASSISSDTILEQIDSTYDSGSRVTITKRFSRDHDGSGTGSALTSSTARPQYTHFYYDATGRQTHTVEYGTNGSSESAPSYAGSPPSSSDTVLVSITDYDSQSGRAYQQTNPKGQITRYIFDDAGRVLAVAENYINFAYGTDSTIGGSSGETDQDRVTKYTYTNGGDVKTIQAYLTSSTSETTKYIYGITKGVQTEDSRFVSNSVLKAIIYPDSDDADSPLGNGSDSIYDRVELQYNRQGEVRWMKEQRGVVRLFEYDKLGRLTRDYMTSAPPSPVDGAVREINRSYNILGWLDKVTSKDSSAATINQLQFTYNGFGQVLATYQALDGAVGTGTTKVSNTYAAGTLASRQTSLVYPSSFTVDYNYASGLDSTLSRLTSLKDGANDIVSYQYLGLNVPVTVSLNTTTHPMILDATKGSDSTSSKYLSWDQFNRVTLQNWYHDNAKSDGSDVDVVKIGYSYDRNSNRLTHDEQITLPSGFKRDELYTYDGINRLNRNDRGTLSSGSISESPPTQQEKWTLDALGNWDTVQVDGNGDGAYTGAADLNDDRSHNSANEMTTWDPYPGNSGNSPVNPAFDRAGNVTDDAWNYKYIYDAWNRLVRVDNQSNTAIGYYTYDGLGRRVKRIVDTDTDGAAETNGQDLVQREYYTNAWQRIEVRPKGTTTSDSSTNGMCLYVYGIRYVDDIVQRQRETNDSGPVDETFYYMTDANYNVVTTVNQAGEGIERVYYSAYGVPECYSFGDADYDYTVENSDANVGGGYSILKDINLDGVANQTDVNLGANYVGYLGDNGELTCTNGSGVTRGNEIGYAGYLWADERSQWHVRHRELSPRMGRWLQRDPVGYDAGMQLYEYARSVPIHQTDPTGQYSFMPDCRGDTTSHESSRIGFDTLTESIRKCYEMPDMCQRYKCIENMMGIFQDAFGIDLSRDIKLMKELIDLYCFAKDRDKKWCDDFYNRIKSPCDSCGSCKGLFDQAKCTQWRDTLFCYVRCIGVYSYFDFACSKNDPDRHKEKINKAFEGAKKNCSDLIMKCVWK